VPRPNAAVIRFTHLHPCHSPQTTITGWIGEPESSHVKSATDRCRIRMVFGKALNRPAGCAEPDLQQALRFVATKPLRLARMRSCPSADLGRPPARAQPPEQGRRVSSLMLRARNPLPTSADFTQFLAGVPAVFATANGRPFGDKVTLLVEDPHAHIAAVGQEEPDGRINRDVIRWAIR